MLASGGLDQAVRLWDSTSLEPLRVLHGHAATVRAVAFSPDGRLLASGDGAEHVKRGELRIWETGSGKELHRFPGHPHWVFAVAFSADGKQLASVSIDGTVKVWDLVRGQELHAGALSFKQKNGKKAREKLVVAFSPDKRSSLQDDLPEGMASWLLAYSAADNRVRLWDLSANGEAGVLSGSGDDNASALTFSPDGRRLVSASKGTIKLWDMVTRQELYSIPGGDNGVHSLAFSPDGWRLIGARYRLLMWDARPVTPEAAVEREALGLLDGLFTRSRPREEILQHLRTHPAISEPVRQRALELAPHFREDDKKLQQ
jgi:WD40 repeat protein